MRAQTFDSFLREFAWKQGQHVSIVGPTGRGKTTLALRLLCKRTYRVIFHTKPEDDTLDPFIKQNKYKIVKRWVPDDHTRNYVLKPTPKDAEDFTTQAVAFRYALNDIYHRGGWTILADEMYFMAHMLKISKPFEMLWVHGRSLGISLLTATQRPVDVPKLMFSMPHHVFIYKFGDEGEYERLKEIAGVSRQEMLRLIRTLEPYQFLYVNVDSGDMRISRVQ